MKHYSLIIAAAAAIALTFWIFRDCPVPIAQASTVKIMAAKPLPAAVMLEGYRDAGSVMTISVVEINGSVQVAYVTRDENVHMDVYDRDGKHIRSYHLKANRSNNAHLARGYRLAKLPGLIVY